MWRREEKLRVWNHAAGHMYHDGWMASSRSFVPWGPNRGAFDPLAAKWELYEVGKDFSQAENVTDRQPDKVQAMEALFWKEAENHSVLPLDWRAGLLDDEGRSQILKILRRYVKVRLEHYRVGHDEAEYTRTRGEIDRMLSGLWTAVEDTHRRDPDGVRTSMIVPGRQRGVRPELHAGLGEPEPPPRSGAGAAPGERDRFRSAARALVRPGERAPPGPVAGVEPGVCPRPVCRAGFRPPTPRVDSHRSNTADRAGCLLRGRRRRNGATISRQVNTAGR